METKEEWRSIHENQSAKLAKAANDLESAIGSNLSVPVSLYLRLILELMQSHHDSLYEIRDEISEFEESITTIEKRLEALEEERE